MRATAMTASHNLDNLFADAELPFGHPGRNFDDTPERFDPTPITGQGPEPDYTPDESNPIVHYAPGDRPLCGTRLHDRGLLRRPIPGRRLRRMPGARRRGPRGPQRLPRPLPPLPAGDHRLGRSRMAPGRPEALSSLRKVQVVIQPGRLQSGGGKFIQTGK